MLKILSQERTYVPNNKQTEVTELLVLNEEDWTYMIKTGPTHSRATRSKAKLFEIWTGIAYTNKAYKRFGHKEDAKCSFCPEPQQGFKHLFIECEEVKRFQNQLGTKWGVNITRSQWFTSRHQHPEIAFLIREALIYIQKRNWEGQPLVTHQLEARVRNMEKTEATIAEKNHNLFDHLVTWEAILGKVNM